MKTKKRVIFHRSWTKFNGGTSGGQLKVRDAFEHFRTSPHFEPKVYFGPETVWFDNPGNYWHPYRSEALTNFDPQKGDVIFFAGKDWGALDETTAISPPVPVLNIAQPRHVRPEDPRHAYLKYPAIRIAKSTLGKKILEDYGVNGPVYLVPDTIDFSLLPAPVAKPDIDVLIIGLKNEGMAKKLYRRLTLRKKLGFQNWNIHVQLPPKLPTRQDFLGLVNRSKIIVCLPLEAKFGAEGFYLPALEAMAMNKLVICPEAIGNTDFCIPDETCLQPAYRTNNMYKAIIKALKMSPADQDKIISNGKAISANHSIEKERKTLLDLLHNADDIWQNDSLFPDRI